MLSAFTIRSIKRLTIFLTISFCLPVTVISQDGTSYSGKIDTVLDDSRRQKIVETIINTMNEYYIHREKAAAMADLLRKNLDDGVYDGFETRGPFIRGLTKDLRSVTNDLHLGVWPIEWSLTLDEISEEAKSKETAMVRYGNYGLPTVRRLQGNIGYLEILDFEGPPGAAAATVAAMNFLSSCDALIIDLRRCGGGEGYSGRLLLSYLFEEPTHYATIYTRHTDKTEQAWTMPYVAGPRMADIPVYILQSRRTASAAESMSYSLQTLERATVVGEKSRGAANPVDELNFPELSICIAVSISEVISPVTGISWEGVGIEPDIDVPAESALPTACRHALIQLLQKETDDDIQKLRQWALDLYEAQLNPITLDKAEMDQLCGEYSSSVTVWKEGERVYMRRHDGEPAVTLIPLGNDEFAVEEREARAKFMRDDQGAITKLVFIFADGYDYTFKRLGE